MATEMTLAMIKPDAVKKNVIGSIIARIEAEGLRIAAMKMVHMSPREAGGFYYVHKERPFYGELVDFMSSGPAVLMILEGEGAIKKWRDLMGPTNPAEAGENTLRKLYGTNIQNNAVHGSDAPETAAFEMAYLFGGTEVVNASR